MVPVWLEVPRCEEIADRLSEFLDGELAPEVAAGITLHLAVCADCARFTAELAATVQALHGLARAPHAALSLP